ncbi:MAG: replication factor C small subunit [Candidatus Aenigmarchaeota archaeon]|nr:replication factor C small subunit [Candidatus Aenigmarchaeota archaeon]
MEIWTEKYRPKTLGDVINQKHVVNALKSWVSEGSIPHILFSGRAGVGKTTVAIALARDLFKDNWEGNFLELNASSERGIDVIRGRIKDFARIKSIGTEFKIIFLDEADSLTPEAQQALRRTMEMYSGSCRFILSCNYSSRLIEPIQSRCAVFRFKELSKEDVLQYIDRIIKNECITAEKEGVEAVYEVSGGDLRKTTNILQAASTLGTVTKDSVYVVSSQAKPKDIEEMLSFAVGGKFKEARKKLYELIVSQGLSGEDVVRSIHRQIFELELPEEAKLKLLELIGEYEYRLNMGSDELIQLEAFLAQVLKTGKSIQ